MYIYIYYIHNILTLDFQAQATSGTVTFLVQVIFLHGFPFDHTNEGMLDDVLRLFAKWTAGETDCCSV